MEVKLYNEEQKIAKMLKTSLLILFMLLLSSFLKIETVILILLCMIYSNMRD